MADKKKSNDVFKNLWAELTKPPKWMKEGKKTTSSDAKKKDDGKKDEAGASSAPKKRQPPSWWSWSTSDGVPAKQAPKDSKKKRNSNKSAAPSKSARNTPTAKPKSKPAHLPPLAQGKSDLGSRDHEDSLGTIHSMIRRHGFSPAALKAYGITATKVEPFGPVLRLRTSKGLIALKKTDLSPKQVQFLQEAFQHLENRKFTRYAPFLLSADGLPYVQVGGETYYATQWVRGQEVDFRSRPQLALTARTLAEFHEASRGFEPKGYRPAMIFDLVDRFQDRRDEFLTWKKRAKAKSRPDEVDKKFLHMVDTYIAQSDQALTILKRPNVRAHLLYEEDDPPLCHLDLTPYNMVYTTTGQVCLIDLDFCTYGPRTLDLAHLARRALQRADWEEDVMRHALVNYNAVRLLTVPEYVLLHGLLVFPHRFWRISYQHYEIGHDPHHMGYYELAEAEEEKRQAFLKKFGQQVDRMRR
jgi:CotS family spore coat protein